MKLPAYPRTKHSGVEWLGDVPDHWEVKPLKHLTDFINGAPFKPEDWSQDGVPIIRIENLNGGDNFNGYEGSVRERYHVSKGDLLFGWSGNRGTSFGPFLWRREGLHYLNQHIFRLAHFSCDRSWFYWALKAVTKTIEDEAHGIIGMVHVTKGKLGAVQIPFLPPAEQLAIAAFLDRETGRVDRLVVKKRELIERLKEKRTALISRTVTRGLPPAAARAAGLPANPPLKPSALDWLGDIPAHWFRTTLKRVVSVCGRIGFRGYTTDDLVDEGDGALALGGANLTDIGRLDFTKRTYLSWPKYEESPEIKVAVNDLVIGQRGTCGNVVLIDRDIGPATINPSLVLLKRPKIHGGFLCYWLMGRFIQSIFDSYLSATAVPMLSQQQIGNVPVCHPPLREQAAIAAYLDLETAKLDALVGKVAAAVERLQEYRTALITAAVTGKIDVRKTGSSG